MTSQRVHVTGSVVLARKQLYKTTVTAHALTRTQTQMFTINNFKLLACLSFCIVYLMFYRIINTCNILLCSVRTYESAMKRLPHSAFRVFKTKFKIFHIMHSHVQCTCTIALIWELDWSALCTNIAVTCGFKIRDEKPLPDLRSDDTICKLQRCKPFVKSVVVPKTNVAL